MLTSVIRRSGLLLSVGTLLVGGLLSRPLLAQNPPTAAEIKEMSRRVWKEQIRRDGRISDSGRLATVGTIIDRLQQATGQPGLTLTWAIVNNDTVNAWATPGGYIAVFRGLMDFTDSVARQEFPRNPAAARRRSAVFLASVLAHELSHVTLGHGGDPRVSSCMERFNQEGGVALNADVATGAPVEGHLIRSSVDCMKYSQAQELAADQMGAFYLLRENWRGVTDWSIQAMIDFFTAMDRMDRQKSYFLSPYLTSYLSDHPRTSTRIAELEMYRARLKLDQTRFDDALSLIANNMELDLAVALLDSVMQHFPDLTAAKMARAAAFERKYLNTVPVQMQQVRASVPTLRAAFLENIRGEDMGDENLRTEAHRQLEALISVDNAPATLSDLSILDAYSGDLVLAERRARAALAQDTLNAELTNNLGVVLFLAGRYPAARDAFKSALTLSGDTTATWSGLPVLFNYGRSLIALNDPQGPPTLRSYLKSDENSEWAKEARRLLGQGAASSQPQTSPLGKAPKTRLEFGVSQRQVIATMGQPESVERDQGMTLLRYRNGGLVLIIHPQRGLSAYLYLTREAGDLDGVRVGDPIDSVQHQWGSEVEVRDDVHFFKVGPPTVMVKVQQGKIVQLAVGILD
jgi:predicted Zn-dependent protease